MGAIKGLVIVLALVVVGLVVSGCGNAPTVTPMPAMAGTNIAPKAHSSLIKRYFPDRTHGDLYVGYIVEIKLDQSADTFNVPVRQVTLTFATGEVVTVGYLTAGQYLQTGCWALLFNKDSSRVGGMLMLDKKAPLSSCS